MNKNIFTLAFGLAVFGCSSDSLPVSMREASSTLSLRTRTPDSPSQIRYYVTLGTGPSVTSCAENVTLGTGPSVTFSALSPGDYRIYAVGSDDLSAFTLPSAEEASETALITPTTDFPEHDLLLADTLFTLAAGDNATIDITFHRAILRLDTVTLHQVPNDATAASLTLSPLHQNVTLGTFSKPITIIDDGTETNETRLGAVCDLLFAMDKLHIDDDMLVVAADNLLFFSFSEFVDFAKAKGTSCIMCHEQPSIEKLQRTGVVELDADGKVLGMEEKPQQPKSHWAVPPFYIYLKKDLDLVRHAVENGCGKDAPGNLAHYMVQHTTMHAWKMTGGRFDIGSLDTYYEACDLASKGKI